MVLLQCRFFPEFMGLLENGKVLFQFPLNCRNLLKIQYICNVFHYCCTVFLLSSCIVLTVAFGLSKPPLTIGLGWIKMSHKSLFAHATFFGKWWLEMMILMMYNAACSCNRCQLTSALNQWWMKMFSEAWNLFEVDVSSMMKCFILDPWCLWFLETELDYMWVVSFMFACVLSLCSWIVLEWNL